MRYKEVVIASVLIVLTITAVVMTAVFFSAHARVTASSPQYVNSDRIFDADGREVIWRGAGGSYLFHTNDYRTAWRKHLPQIKQMGLNTIRLVFAFPDSGINPDTGAPSADILDYAKLDWVLDFLDKNNLRAILDLHNVKDMYGDFGSQKLIDNWVALARRYRGDARIVAYELFNEPYWNTWAPSLRARANKENVLWTYQNLTRAVREVDPEHIVIWQSSSYLPVPLENYTKYFEPNIVFTMHRWWRREIIAVQPWSLENFSRISIGSIAEMREKLKIPFWLGEFGSYQPFDGSNPEWLLTEQTLFNCEEEALGWNLWMGRVDADKPWNAYLPFFPLKIYANEQLHNMNLNRKTWFTSIPNLIDYLRAHKGVDKLEPYLIEIRHNRDYVTFKPGITIFAITYSRDLEGTIEIINATKLRVTDTLTIRNEEYTAETPKDMTIRIFALDYF